eukprot:TRINITY_DN4610_c0_g1_i1.p1 TRINITY_DN4610_c0_g1~~TRINITY_DN4610_c0_g1_i1.p1  ORF type:complete len:142 (-),score=27.78 TRINITY_DN4610_c0_g1_i1:83-508(-)
MSDLSTCEPILKIYQGDPNFQRKLPDLKILRSEKNKITFGFKINPSLINIINTIHGGEIAYIADYLTTCVLAQEGKPLGVSVCLNTTYLAPAVLGDEIEVENRIDQIGRAMAYLSAELYKKTPQGRKLIAYATHTKALPRL